MESKNMIKSYEAPIVDVIEVQVERGFATSGDDYINNNPDFEWGF
jgi:hypothetical protein